MIKTTISFICFLLVSTSYCIGETHNSSTCNNTTEQPDIQNAINSASDGDTVIIPAGSCSINSKITLSGKGISIIGAGIDATTISEDIGGTVIDVVTDSTKSPVRISNFTLSNVNGVLGAINISGNAKDWRIDHINMTNMTGRGISISGVTYGVIDNCVFSGENGQNCILVQDSETGVESWSRSFSFGTSDAVYVENCTFIFQSMETGNSPIDSRAGGRIVFRYNNVTNMIIGTHGICSSLGSSYRGTLSREVYNNKFNVLNVVYTMIGQEASGTGLYFSNRGYGPFNAGIKIVEKRTCDGAGVECTEWDRCDGDSIYDGNEDSTGWPCLDQIGRGPNQSSMPMREWDNLIDYNMDGSYEVDADFSPVDLGCSNPGYADHLQESRDYFNDTTLEGYTPYTCPHPLTGLTGYCDSSIAGRGGYAVGQAGISFRSPQAGDGSMQRTTGGTGSITY